MKYFKIHKESDCMNGSVNINIIISAPFINGNFSQIPNRKWQTLRIYCYLAV